MTKIVFFICMIIISQGLFAASFDCNKAKTEIEHAICDNKNVSRLDEGLNYTYQQFYIYKNTDEKISFRKQQLRWIKNRDIACSAVDNKKECLISEYKSRIKEIEIENKFMLENMTVAEPKLLEFLKVSKKFHVNSVPGYFKINDEEFVVAIDWGQGGRMQLGLYYVSLKDNLLTRVVAGYPSFDGIYKDKERAVIVIDSGSESRGLGWRMITAVEIFEGTLSKEKVSTVRYYATDGEYEDKCFDPSNKDKGRLETIGAIGKIEVADLDLDGYRDLSIEVISTDCTNRKSKKIKHTFMSRKSIK